MHRNARHELNEYLKDVRSQYALQSKRLAQLEGYVSRKLKVRKHPNGTAYYSVLEPGSRKYKYLGKECDEEVSKIKEAHLLQLSVKELEREIQLVEKTLKLSRNIGYEQINKRLSPVYRNSMLSEPSGFSDVARKWKKKMEEYKSTFPPYRLIQLNDFPKLIKMAVKSHNLLSIVYLISKQGGLLNYPIFINVLPGKVLLHQIYQALSVACYNVRRQLFHGKTDRSDIRYGIHHSNLMEMDHGDLRTVGPALSLRDEPVYLFHIRLYLIR